MSEIKLGNIALGHTCEECSGKRGSYAVIKDCDGKLKFKSGAYGDPIWEKCRTCEGKGFVDTETGANLRRWLGG